LFLGQSLSLPGLEKKRRTLSSGLKKRRANRLTKRCVDSRWLGHRDGGALAMKVYGHLRDQHSSEMAQKVTFKTMPDKEIKAA
jgi:hypothetical protein